MSRNNSTEYNNGSKRVFSKMREFALTHEKILLQLTKLEGEVSNIGRTSERNCKEIESILMVLKELIEK